jgi:ActR/RegA family two-component response regulator
VPLSGKRLLIVDADGEAGRALAAAAAARGAEAVLVGGGRAALAEADRAGAAAAVVDLPLADVRGDALLVALRDRGVVCLAVSATLRGPHYAAMAREFGAVAYLEKPFPPEEALRVLDAAVPGDALPDDAAVPADAAPAADPVPELAALPPFPGDAPLARPATPAPPAPRAPAADPAVDVVVDDPEFDSVVFSAARPALDDTLPGLPLGPLPPDGLSLPLPGSAPTPPPRAGAPALPEGNLGPTTVPRLLAHVHATRTTGALTLTRDGAKKLVLFEAGRPVFAVSNVASERFGARAVGEGILSAAELARLQGEEGARAPTAELLLARGLLDPARRAALVREQIRDIVWSTFGWRDGAYKLLASALARRPPVPVVLDPGELLRGGLLRAALEDLRRDLPGGVALARGASPSFTAGELGLAPEDERLLALADGTKTVADLVLLAERPEREALALLLACREAGLLDAVARGLAGTRRIGFM